MNIEQIKSLILKKSITIKYDRFEIELTSFVGNGTYNVVFLGSYNDNGVEKKSIIKFFLPPILLENQDKKDDKDEKETKPVEMEYDFELVENNGKYEITHILLKVPAQVKLYKMALQKYQISNNQMIEMLNDIEVNSFVPTPFNERVMTVSVSEDASIDLINCVMCFEYSLSTSLKDYLINCLNITERIRVVKCITSVLNKIYKSNKKLIMLDLKIDNFLFKSNGQDGLDDLYIIDWDSLVRLNQCGHIDKDAEVNCTEYVSPQEILNVSRDIIGVKSCIFMLGYMLYIALLLPYLSKKEVSLYLGTADEFDKVEIKESIIKELKNIGVTQGFILRLIKILTNSYNSNIDYRYSTTNDLNEFELFMNDLDVLIEIYNHKGVHPEVMFDYACEMAEDPNFLKEYEEELLCDIEEVN